MAADFVNERTVYAAFSRYAALGADNEDWTHEDRLNGAVIGIAYEAYQQGEIGVPDYEQHTRPLARAVTSLLVSRGWPIG